MEDDAQLESIKQVFNLLFNPHFHFFSFQAYKSGEMNTGKVKSILSDVLSNIVVEHQKRRALVTDEVIASFMSIPHSPETIAAAAASASTASASSAKENK